MQENLSADFDDEKNQNTVKYFDGLAGGGKTFTLAKVAKKRAQLGQKIIIAMISKTLINDTVEKYFANKTIQREVIDANGWPVETDIDVPFPVPVTVIHSDNGSNQDSVTQRLLAYFAVNKDTVGGSILVITHSGLLGMPFIEGKKGYYLIIDEAPQPSAAYCLPIPDSHSIITKHLAIEESHLVDYSLIKPTNLAALQRIARNKHDDIVYNVLRKVCNDLSNPNVISYTRTGNYKELIQGKRGERPTNIWIFSELNASVFDGFREVVVVSALFKETMLYKAWSSDGIGWLPASGLWRLKDAKDVHDNGECLKIYYALTHDFSKKLRTNVVDDGGEMTIIQNILARIENLFADEQFLYSINNDISDEDKWGGKLLPASFEMRGKRLSGSPHGINSYMNDWHNVAIISALNPAPQHFAFQKARGIDGKSLKDAMYRTTCYQIMLRCSLRNPNSKTAKKVVVMDRSTADFLAALFPGSQVLYLPNLKSECELRNPAKPIGRPPIHETQADKQASYRFRKAIEARKSELRTRINNLSINNLIKINVKDISLSHSIISNAIFCEEAIPVTNPSYNKQEIFKDFRNAIGSQVEFPVFTQKTSKTACDFHRYRSSVDFLKFLFNRTSRVVASKSENRLISTSCFAAKEGVSTSLGRENVLYTFGIWFDCDGQSELTPAEFASWFPYLEMVFYATSRSRPDDLRWRAYIPTSMGMDFEVYMLIKDQFVRTINDKGYWSAKELTNPRICGRPHGFDRAVWRPETKIYLPAVPADPDGAYGAIYVGEGRAPIDVMHWIDTQIDAILEQQAAPEQEKELLLEAVKAPEFAPVEACISSSLQHLRWSGEQLKQVSAPGSSRDAAVARATDKWRDTCCGDGHAEFWRYACRLAAIGLGKEEIENMLGSEAYMSHTTDAERVGEIAHIMDCLRSRGTF